MRVGASGDSAFWPSWLGVDLLAAGWGSLAALQQGEKVGLRDTAKHHQARHDQGERRTKNGAFGCPAIDSLPFSISAKNVSSRTENSACSSHPRNVLLGPHCSTVWNACMRL